MSNGFVIGNGRSRRNFQLERLKGHGIVVGCNALYRDTYVKNKWDLPDYLVAIDPTIIEEIKESEFPQQRFVVPPEENDKFIKKFKKFTIIPFNFENVGSKIIMNNNL